MSLSTERERVIESLRAGIGATAEYVDPSEFVVIREAGGTLHFYIFKADGAYVPASIAVGSFYSLPDPLPELPVTPTEQDIADALIELGLVTQAVESSSSSSSSSSSE
jgi:hypothetical protein